MACKLKDFDRKPKPGTLAFMSEIKPDQVIELDLHPTGMRPFLFTTANGVPLFAVAGSPQSVKVWAEAQGLMVLRSER